ncbi:MAG: DUF3090 family protein [Ardenticatenaceae bacterium]
MAEPKLHFTNVTKLSPEAMGEPGKRTFRVLVDSGSSNASLWLEKEQLFQLALAIQQVIGTLSENEMKVGQLPTDMEAPGLTSLDFKVSKLVLGHDASKGMFIIEAHDMEDADLDSATIRVWANKEQMEGFAEDAFRVCAAGRPLCPLCGRAIDREGHQCVRLNGHRSHEELRTDE